MELDSNSTPHVIRRVVVTGATGFIGGGIVARLVADGHRVTTLVRRDTDDWRIRDLEHTQIVGDILDRASLDGLFVGADWIIHAAGKLGEAGVAESVYEAVHVTGTSNVLDAITQDAPDARVLHISTPGLLGPLDTVDLNRLPDENSPYQPTNPYERTKMRGELLVLEAARNSLDLVVMRPEFVYGPGDLHVMGLFQAIANGRFFYIGDGTNYCHPTYIEDVIDGTMLCLNHGVRGEIYHITGEAPIRWQELVGVVAAETGAALPRLKLPRGLIMAGAIALEAVGGVLGIRPPLSRTGVDFFSENRATSWEKARAELGYTPQFDIRRGVAATVAWYRDQGHMT